MKKYLIFILCLTLCSFLKLKAQSLEDYFKIAAEHNPGLQAQYKIFESALERIPQARALEDPALSVGFYVPSMETLMGNQVADISLSQMFPWFGTLKARGDQATLLAEAQYQAFLDSKNKLYLEIAQIYYPLYELHRLREIEKTNIQILESFKALSTNQFSNGKGSMADVLRASVQLKSAETNLEILNKKEAALTGQFNSLLNRDYHAPVVLPDSINLNTLPIAYRIDSLSLNPKLVEIALQEQASEAAKRVAIKDGFPKLGVGLDYMLVRESDNPMMEHNGKNMLMPMVSVSLPIFRKKYQAARKETELMKEAYAFQKKEIVNQLHGSYQNISFQIRQQADLIALYDVQIEETHQILDLLYSAYSNSGQDFDELLKIQQQLLEYQKMKTSAESEYLIAIAELHYITAKQY